MPPCALRPHRSARPWSTERVRSAPYCSDIDLFGDCKSVIDFDAEVSNGALDFHVTQHDPGYDILDGIPILSGRN